MPTILREHGYRFFFFSKEGQEPPHVHVEYGEGVAKFWLKPVLLASSYGMRSHELNEVKKLVEENSKFFLEKWHEYFAA